MRLRQSLPMTDGTYSLPPGSPPSARIVVDKWDGGRIVAASVVAECSSHEGVQRLDDGWERLE